MSMLAGDDAQAIGRIRALLPPGAQPGQMRPAGMPAQHWIQLSEPARGRFLRARDPDLRPAGRLRYRTGTPAAGIPAAGPDRLAARARMIPQLLWPDWAIRLTPAEGLLPGPLRATLDIDLEAVRQLIITEQLPVGEAATRLGTSTEHVRLALEHVPRPARHWGRSTLPVAWQWQQRARAVLTYHRSAPGQPMRPTQRGSALLTALARPDIQAAAAGHAPDVSGPPGGSGRYRERMPASPGSRTADAQQAARLFRSLAEPTRRAIILTLQDGERRITDLAAELGGSQTSISSHVTSLKECGLITGRPQGRSVYYRLARPALDSLLEAAETLLAAAGQRVRLSRHDSQVGGMTPA